MQWLKLYHRSPVHEPLSPLTPCTRYFNMIQVLRFIPGYVSILKTITLVAEMNPKVSRATILEARCLTRLSASGKRRSSQTSSRWMNSIMLCPGSNKYSAQWCLGQVLAISSSPTSSFSSPKEEKKENSSMHVELNAGWCCWSARSREEGRWRRCCCCSGGAEGCGQ